MHLGSEAKSILTGKVAGTKGSQKDPSQNCQEERTQKICVLYLCSASARGRGGSHRRSAREYSAKNGKMQKGQHLDTVSKEPVFRYLS